MPKVNIKEDREGGHSEFRILHHKDVTGREMERALLQTVAEQKNIEIIKHCFVVDIITQHHLGYLVTKSTPDIECYGIYALDMQENMIVKFYPASRYLQRVVTDRFIAQRPIP